MVSDAALPFEPAFFERGMCLGTGIEPDLWVWGSGDHLRQVVEILLDNAQKYAALGAEITLTLRRQGRGRCVLAAANPGEPISRTDLEDIFKRFYRRTRPGAWTTATAGLSIDRRIVTARRGKIRAESENGVNTFFVQLPVL